MAKQPTSSRVQRDENVPDDAFVSTIRRIITWTQENQRSVTFGGAAVLLIAAGAFWFISQQRSLEATANARLTQVRQTVASGNVQLAIRDLESFLETFGDTDAANPARITLADILIGQDRAGEALDALGNLPDRLDDPFGLPAARLEASALEALERYDDAARAYQTIADNARFPYQRRAALADAARVHMQHGSPQQAAELFQQVLATFEEAEPGRGYYEMWLAEARGLARATPEQGAASPAMSDSAG